MILGKFMPPHAGHQFLVNFARQFSERLTVLVCSLQSEPIPGKLRFEWMQELFPTVQIVHIQEELPQQPENHPDFWRIWRDVVVRAVGRKVDYVFASESYGYRLAQELDANFVPVDLTRSLVPISGTEIRRQPLLHWDYLPACVRPFFVKRICVFGPESTGKSTLSAKLARHFQTVYVPEFARPWLDPKQGVCKPEDIPIIARGQWAAEDGLAREANRVLICDTDLLTTTIWSDVLFGHCPDWIRVAANTRHYDHYLLCDIDVPWVDDQQRYFPHQRKDFFDRCHQALVAAKRPFTIIQGDWHARFAQACQTIESVLSSPRE